MLFKTTTLTLALILTASTASAVCRATFNNGFYEEMVPGACFFLGTQEDFDTWGAETCATYLPYFIPEDRAPQLNDGLISVGRYDAGRITLLENVILDENILVLDYAEPSGGDTVLEGQWAESVSVMICH